MAHTFEDALLGEALVGEGSDIAHIGKGYLAKKVRRRIIGFWQLPRP